MNETETKAMHIDPASTRQGGVWSKEVACFWRIPSRAAASKIAGGLVHRMDSQSRQLLRIS
jgi:hypothetical protein